MIIVMLGWEGVSSGSSSLSRGGIKNLVLLPQIPSHVISEPCSELSQETSEDAFLVFFHAPCTQFCVEKLWSPTLGPSCAVPWQTVAVTFTPSSVRFNLLQKCVTSQWEVTGTVVYVPQAKMSNAYPQNIGNHETKREQGREYMWRRMRPRMKPR